MKLLRLIALILLVITQAFVGWRIYSRHQQLKKAVEGMRHTDSQRLSRRLGATN